MVIDSLLFMFFVTFAISTIGDILIALGLFVVFRKLIDTKTITAENNRELYEHSTVIANLQEQVQKNGKKADLYIIQPQENNQ